MFCHQTYSLCLIGSCYSTVSLLYIDRGAESTYCTSVQTFRPFQVKWIHFATRWRKAPQSHKHTGIRLNRITYTPGHWSVTLQTNDLQGKMVHVQSA